ncbi:hypothetical protein A176_002776 [Myxococcus hansupus]|uniref:Uncharacterized protein n=1 Tax=Pseudomyxococcus hansupus TaxID=1297742 RepID=A0A0H4WSS4_9BACT|nr:hypothetical protein A176_002776 [Myxococcus hansupus]
MGEDTGEALWSRVRCHGVFEQGLSSLSAALTGQVDGEPRPFIQRGDHVDVSRIPIALSVTLVAQLQRA